MPETLRLRYASKMFRPVRVERVAFPESNALTLGEGTEMRTGEATHFVVPTRKVLGVLAALHAGERPVIEVHDIDVVDWTVWWQPAEE